MFGHNDQPTVAMVLELLVMDEITTGVQHSLGLGGEVPPSRSTLDGLLSDRLIAKSQRTAHASEYATNRLWTSTIASVSCPQ